MVPLYLEKKPSFRREKNGNAIIEIPRQYWQGKDYQSLKIHLSKKVLKNLTYGTDLQHDYYCEQKQILFV